jgi:hypothetical protein
VKTKPRTSKRKLKVRQPAAQPPSIWQQFASISVLILEGRLSHDIGLAFLAILLSLDEDPSEGPGPAALLNIPDIASNIPPAARRRAIAGFREIEAGR